MIQLIGADVGIEEAVARSADVAITGSLSVDLGGKHVDIDHIGYAQTDGDLIARALDGASRCSSDPLCAERLPRAPADFLHGAACHACLFVSETTCERGNRFLDRRFIVPIDDPALVLLPGIG